ncbi:MAG TPA: ATP-binding protein [Bryobacteraceae bacterium]|nr:ATP-binding protein [Bryobacteraceae bacterium]
MTEALPYDTLSGIIASQCVLVALRGVGAEASEEMLWQTLLAELVRQYGFRRACYSRWFEGTLCPVVLAPPDADVEGGVSARAGLRWPVSIEGSPEGELWIEGAPPAAPEQVEQVRMLIAEAAAMLAEHRSRRRYEAAMNAARLEAESASRAKSLMLANMSHEVRTPMAGVLAFADLLAATPLRPDQARYVQTIRSCGSALLALVNDILDLSKLEAGKVELHLQPVDLRALAERVVSLLAVQVSDKPVRLSFRVDAAAPRSILGDEPRLQQVLVNLLGNAVKFTEKGEVSLTVRAEPAGENARRIAFAVRDTGPGIALEDQGRIFDFFTQVDASSRRNQGGAGLGLAISKALVNRMGGSLRVESRLGMGATFHFEMAAQVVEETPGALKPAAGALSHPEAAPPLRIVVTEDNETIRNATLTMLRLIGYEASYATSGAGLLERLAREDFDVILMDVQMPGMDGLETTRRIRRGLPRERQPRIVALTAAAFEEDRQRCLEAGMNDYLSKPVGMDRLAELLAASHRRSAGAGA